MFEIVMWYFFKNKILILCVSLAGLLKQALINVEK